MALEQRTDDWLAWRKKAVCSSDAPIIMNASPYKTRLELYHEKTGAKEGNYSNYAMERGTRLEPEARTQFELLIGEDFSPILAVHPTFDFIRASLDGYNKALNAVLEIKCPGADDHRLAVQGKIPEKYIWQLEHQALVTGADLIYYYSYDGQEGAVVRYKPNKEKQGELLIELINFWNLVQNRTPPEASDKDVMKLDTERAKQLFSQYRKAKQFADEANKVVDSLKKIIVDEFGAIHTRVECEGVSLTKSVKRGAIDYVKASASFNSDFEQFRKEPVTSYVITVREL